MALTKRKKYPRTKFGVEVLRDALHRMGPPEKMKPVSLSVEGARDVEWSFDEMEEFFAAYREPDTVSSEFSFQELGGFANLSVTFSTSMTRVRVRRNQRSEIEHVFASFEASAVASLLPPEETEDILKDSLSIFIGHGRSNVWRDLKDHLHEKHGFQVTAYETGPRVGLHIADILQEMEDEASFAILVMTGENLDAAGLLHARENVIHETGLFQGRLGFHRAIVLLEDGCAEFSNVAGIQYLPFSKGNIKETFGEVLATIRREFGSKDG
ncbi:nucleotide-binding protein [Bradyrhizobium tropiciagri]|uniref:TIR domain-containing protein n=1 Tax=Bradyrhizobium tropiciagri TaxID=312253 RepID=UPI001BA90333|nr:nucleotide-binding protein [Bradyrhizobium tropiciagri]MBR0895780.1 nucleotide-binding protein [Bradyrhizobium tropiciagri]